MSWLQRYGDGIKATVVAVGITTGIGAWTYYNLSSIGENRKKIELQTEQRKLSKKQTIGVIIDSSLEYRVRNDTVLALKDVVESYKKYVNIDFNLEFKFVEIPGEVIEESDLYHLVPSSFKSLDHRLFITNSSVLLEEGDSGDTLGFYRYNKSTAVVHRAYLHRRDALYNLISHELAHGQRMYHHVSDKNCIMYATMDSNTRKTFCDEMVRFMIEIK